MNNARMDNEIIENIYDLVFSNHQLADGYEVHISHTEESLTRFANNIIHQNLFENSIQICIRALIDQKTSRISVNTLNPDKIQEALRTAIELAKISPQDPNLPPLPEPQHYSDKISFAEETYTNTPIDRAQQVNKVIQIAQSNGLDCAGVLASATSHYYLGNSKGLRAASPTTMATFSTTMHQGNSTGWVKKRHPNICNMDIHALSQIAAGKALQNRNQKELLPGLYTVILEPAALVDLLEFSLFDFGVTSVLEKRSCFTDKLGQKIFADNITISDNIYHPMQTGTPFDGEGIPRSPVTLVKNGVLTNFVTSQSSAMRMKTIPTGHGFMLPNAWGEAPMHIVMKGENTSLDEMIRSTQRGVLITRLWYIRDIDPMSKTLTGMTRDGTFMIENGTVSHAIKNMRFNISLFDLFNHIVAMSAHTYASGEEGVDMVVPAVKVESFPFTSATTY
ncbi:MAG: TldD/PmbA family protein [Chlamydiota bacterium]|nr:TldD/PmbA family protein [Chlamydiota bacterium]